MGNLYREVGQHLVGQHPDSLVVEVGSDRFEGSTYYFADLANQHGMNFITVDLDLEALRRARKSIPEEWQAHCDFILCEAVAWTAQHVGKIKVLYLDNFDWDWSTERHSDMIAEQRVWYHKQGLTMNNLTSQVSHLHQMINLLPHMADECVVCVDDTYTYNGVYIGKGGAVVPYLLSQGFGLLAAKDYGVILGRGYKNYIV